MILLGIRYTQCISSSQVTCGPPNLEPERPVGGYYACEKRCNEDINCKFIFHIPGQNCLRYAVCDTITTTNNVGSTYAKNGNCPGINFETITIW